MGTSSKSQGPEALRPRCSGIQPDADNKGYYCLACGYELIIRGAWFRHGTEWTHPEVWR